jgi:hypothetical protein
VRFTDQSVLQRVPLRCARDRTSMDPVSNVSWRMLASLAADRCGTRPFCFTGGNQSYEMNNTDNFVL